MLRQIRRDCLCQLRIEAQAHLGQLHADVRIEFALRNRIEQSMVDIGRGVRLLRRRDTLPQRIQRDMHPLPIHRLGDAQRILELHACDKASAELVADRRALKKTAQRAMTGEGNKSRT